MLIRRYVAAERARPHVISINVTGESLDRRAFRHDGENEKLVLGIAEGFIETRRTDGLASEQL